MLLLLAVTVLSLGFTSGNAKTKAAYCGPHLTVNNYGSTIIRSVVAYNYNAGYDVTADDLATGTSTYLIQWSHLSIIDVKVLLDTPQNGSIKVYRNGILVECIPTNSTDYRYDFTISCFDCDYYTVEVSTFSC